MKNYLIYMVFLFAGLLLGWFVFSHLPCAGTTHDHDEAIQENRMWTCSMHPQIKRPEQGDCPICGMDLIPVNIGNEGFETAQFKLTKNAVALANIQTSIVRSENDAANTIILSGKISENEEANTVQISYFNGRIEQLHINATGEKVKKGQLLATIYSPDLITAQQELITTFSLRESQPILYKAVRNKLKQLRLSEAQITEIETLGEVKETFPVYATISGTVLEKLVEQGAYVKQGQPLLKVSNFNTVWANFDVYENQIGLFKIGQEILISANAISNKKIKARIYFIDPVMNTKKRTATLKAILNNTTGELKPGMFVKGELKILKENKNQTLTIPSTTILWTGKRSIVYVKVNPGAPVFEMREVLLGKKVGMRYEVLEGLNQGDEIVTNGAFTVDAAAQLQGKGSMMNKEKTNNRINSNH